jgi:transcriptional regulator with XRE-family HTH domain
MWIAVSDRIPFLAVDAAALLRQARREAGLSLRALADRAGTSHSTLVAYEAGRKTPSIPTLERLLRAAGFDLTVELRRSVGRPDREAKGRELAEVLALAEQFPARHARRLAYPVFGRR